MIGDDDVFFTWVESIAVDDSGRIYVSEGSPESSIRIFDVNGAHVGNLGSQGAGPGEYRMAGRIMLDPDSIVVFDSWFHSRLVYNADGTPRRSLPRFQATAPRSSFVVIDRVRGGNGYFGYQTRYMMPGM